MITYVYFIQNYCHVNAHNYFYIMYTFQFFSKDIYLISLQFFVENVSYTKLLDLRWLCHTNILSVFFYIKRHSLAPGFYFKDADLAKDQMKLF